jgi:hypothetical protein
MNKPWGLHLTVDAAGSDDYNVRTRSISARRDALEVRIGPMLVYCVDGQAVNDLSAAWATALVRVSRRLRLTPGAPTTPKPPRENAAAKAKAAGGLASPASEIVVAGKQPFRVIPPHDNRLYATVATSWLTVRVHDRIALETYTQAWSLASAVGGRLLDPAPPPFAQLVRDARYAEGREHFPEPTDRGHGRER